MLGEKAQQLLALLNFIHSHVRENGAGWGGDVRSFTTKRFHSSHRQRHTCSCQGLRRNSDSAEARVPEDKAGSACR